MNWKDVTSYSRSDKERTPTSWSTRAGDFHIAVSRGHIYHRGTWIMNAEPFYREYEMRDVPLDDVAEAQRYALDLVRAKLMRALEAFD